MIIVKDGQYQNIENTKTLQTSDHPAYQAGIEVSLPKGSWIGAPSAGIDLGNRKKQSPRIIEEIRKELNFYLAKYNPAVKKETVERFVARWPILIKEDAFNV